MSTTGTSISKLEGIDTTRTWKVEGNKVKIGKEDHAIFEHDADAHDAIVAHNAVDDTLALVEAAKLLTAMVDSSDGERFVSIRETPVYQSLKSAVAKFVP